MVCKHENGLQVINVLALVNSHFVLIFSASTKNNEKTLFSYVRNNKAYFRQNFSQRNKNHVNVTLDDLITVHFPFCTAKQNESCHLHVELSN